jgi:hypothetical protein
MPSLGEYSNVYNTALLILQQKGFRVWYEEEANRWACERDGWDFFGDSPTGLLGLVAIFEYKRPVEWREYWWREDGPWVQDELPRTAPEYTPVFLRDKRG